MEEVREFSGLVELPTPTTMDLSLRILRLSADATPFLDRFFATLFAQDAATVSGTYTLQTNPPREGEVEGTFAGASFFTAGQFDGVLIENTGNCTARRQYSGPVTATGINLVAGPTLESCPSAPFSGLSSIGLTATGPVTVNPAPDPDPAPEPAPDPDPEPEQVLTLTVVLAGSGGGTVASTPAGIDCGTDCTETYPEGTAVTLTPTSAAGSVFAGWSGDDGCDAGAVTMDADHSCTATFDESTGPSSTLTVTLGGSGSGSVTSNPPGITCGDDCSQDYPQGTMVTLTPTAAAGSLFGGWTGHPDCRDDEVTMSGARTCAATFDLEPSDPSSFVLSVTVEGTGGGTVTSSPPGITCGGDCSEAYNQGTVVTLMPVPEPGSTFAGWSGGSDCADASVTMNGPRACIATFNMSPVGTFALTVSKTGSGSGTVTTSPAGINCGADCTESYEEGTIVILIPNPGAGSTFAGWSGGGDCTDGSVTMNGARNCTAAFDAIPPNTLAVTLSGTGSGTVTSSPPGINCGVDCSESYSFGTVVTLTTTADMNSTFGGWTGDPDCTDGSVTMDAAHGCTATFTQITHTLTAMTAGSGMGTVTSAPPGISCGADCTEDYAQGTVVTLTSTPSAGSVFDSWSGDADCSDGTVTMAAPRSCTATFIQTHTLTVTKAGGGTGTVTSSPPGINCGGDCTQSYNQGTVVTLTATPTGGSTFAGFTGGGGDCADGSVTMSAAKTCTATFDAATPQHQLDIVFAGGGSGQVTLTPPVTVCTANCNETYDQGTVVTLTATPTGGSTFAGFTGGGGDCADESVTMSVAKTCTATFDAATPQHQLDIAFAGGGSGQVTLTPPVTVCTANCNETYDQGTVVALAATPAADSTFAGFTGGGGDCGDGSVTMSVAKTCTATFDLTPPMQFMLTVSLLGTGGGTVTSTPAGINCGIDCDQLYDENTDVSLSDMAGAGSTFVSWGGDCDGTGDVTMNANKTCTATFDLIPQFTLTVTQPFSGDGSGTVTSDLGSIDCPGTCSDTYGDGTTVTLMEMPDAGSTFVSWGGDCDAGGSVLMNGPKTCTAEFDDPMIP